MYNNISILKNELTKYDIITEPCPFRKVVKVIGCLFIYFSLLTPIHSKCWGSVSTQRKSSENYHYNFFWWFSFERMRIIFYIRKILEKKGIQILFIGRKDPESGSRIRMQSIWNGPSTLFTAHFEEGYRGIIFSLGKARYPGSGDSWNQIILNCEGTSGILYGSYMAWRTRPVKMRPFPK